MMMMMMMWSCSALLNSMFAHARSAGQKLRKKERTETIAKWEKKERGRMWGRGRRGA